MNIDSLVEAATSKDHAVEIYLASLMTIDVDTLAEKAYLSMLAARLSLEQELVNQIHRTVEQLTIINSIFSNEKLFFSCVFSVKSLYYCLE